MIKLIQGSQVKNSVRYPSDFEFLTVCNPKNQIWRPFPQDVNSLSNLWS